MYILAFVIALLASFLLTPYIKKLAFAIGAVDKPDKRKVHTHIMPRLGGLAIFLGCVLAVVCSLPITRDLMGILLGAAWIVIVGILDDKYSLPAKVKLLGQILAACILVALIFWVISFINVVNLIDGLDGLAAGVSGIASITIILVAVHQGYYPVATMTAALAGGIFGFIHYNFNPATIFMGDTGSMFIGYMLASIAIFGAVKSAATIALIVPAVALGLPIMDTAFAILRRYSNGKPIFQPDKGHLHHRLLALGLSQKQAVLLMYAISIILSLGAFVLAMANIYIACAVIVLIVIAVAVGAKKIGILRNP